MQTYRPDIDGLRTIAVLSVILFHVGYSQFGGGFVGVDIFFTISGYLITKIIVEEKCETGKFDFFRFYMRRARRLLPTLLLVVAATLLVGFFMFPKDLTQDLGGSAVYSLLSISNIYFWLNSGYFDAGANLRPLLHTWSLAVEEQFYLVWPALLVGTLSLAASGRKALLIVLLFVGCGSFLAGELLLNGWGPTYIQQLAIDAETTTFFLAPFRMYEFILGGLVLWLPKLGPKRSLLSDLIALTGIGLMAYGIFFVTEESKFPSYNALVPCLGTALVIWAQNGRFIPVALGIGPMAYLGRISYTLYLIHWPATVYYGFWRAGPLENADRIAVLAVTFVLSATVYHLLEKPLRRPTPKRQQLNRSAFGLVCCFVGLILMLPSASLYRGAASASNLALLETPSEIGEEAQHSVQNDNFAVDNNEKWTPLNANTVNRSAMQRLYPHPCIWDEDMVSFRQVDGEWLCNDRAPIQILTIGNSHERAGYSYIRNVFSEEFRASEFGITYASTHSRGIDEDGKIIRCNFHKLKDLPFRSSVSECKWIVAQLADQQAIASDYDVVVVSALRPNDWGKIYLDYAAQLQKNNPQLRVVVIGSLVSIGDYRCIDLVNQKKDLRACSNNDLVEYYSPNEEDEIRSNWPDLEFFYVDQRKLLCGNGDFESCDIYEDGIPIFFDGSHLNWLATIKLVRLSEETRLRDRLKHYILGRH
ncbi:acyltransferase family protein [Hyphomonas sp. UBA3195]|uniref:acyltransferase family protein n=3 Tax=unclassified Hyphomonas TaxID=2630699 RepID=UPI0025B98CDD|nr:acyltransferase family protein [Hyphomonas sp. UBA3195]